MKKRILSTLVTLSGSLSLLIVGLMPLSASAATTTIYNNIPSPQPGNLPSQAFEATSTSEFGGQVSFAATAQNPKVTVLMSSWGCQTGHWTTGNCTTTPGATFLVPITLNVYNVGAGNTVGSQVATKTQTFNIPYRPSADPACSGGRWSPDGGTNCFNGFATSISFDLTSTLPASAIISVAYNTTHYGSNPVGESAACFGTAAGCGYDSLNVALSSIAPTVGGNLAPNDAYLNSSWGGAYCPSDQTTTGTFRLDSGCWTGFQPAIKVEVAAPMPTGQDQCKKDGWKSFGNTFKNQGDCVSFVVTNGRNQPSGH